MSSKEFVAVSRSFCHLELRARWMLRSDCKSDNEGVVETGMRRRQKVVVNFSNKRRKWISSEKSSDEYLLRNISRLAVIVSCKFSCFVGILMQGL